MTTDPINEYQNMDAVQRALHNERNGYSSFDNDYNPSPEAIEKMYGVLNFIKANPHMWDQLAFGTATSETNCVMGFVCRLNGVPTNVHKWNRWSTDTSETYETDYRLDQAMDFLDFDGDLHNDRANYIADFVDVRNYYADDDDTPQVERTYWRQPTFDEMVERVSIAMGHDFRDRYKTENSAENDNDKREKAFDAFSQALHDSVQDELHGPDTTENDNK